LNGSNLHVRQEFGLPDQTQRNVNIINLDKIMTKQNRILECDECGGDLVALFLLKYPVLSCTICGKTFNSLPTFEFEFESNE
jgi:hypothetical protein